MAALDIQETNPSSHIYRHHCRYRITEGREEIRMRKVAAVMFGEIET